jgi:RNA polymerase-interacting CarD/CdnL/TRCF family regulator
MAKPPRPDYEVGYRKPPKHAQFQSGQSGNPRGRPKGTLNVRTILDRAVRERVTIIEKGKQKSITKLEAAAKQLANKAASGDLRALHFLLPQLLVVDETLALPTEEANLDDQAVMAHLVERFAAPSEAPANKQLTALARRRTKKPKKVKK